MEKRFSLRVIIGVIVGLMGALGLGLALISSTMYHKQALESHSNSFAPVIRLESEDLLEHLTDNLNDLGIALQSDPGFRKSVEQRDLSEIQRRLDSQFYQYFVTADVIKLEKILVYDLQHNLIAASTEGLKAENPQSLVCPSLLAEHKKLKGAKRLTRISRICKIGNKSLFAVIVPIGSLIPKGFNIIISDPSHNLKQMEKAIGMPVQISLEKGATIFQSKNWPTQEILDEKFMAHHHKILDTNGNGVLVVSAAHDLTAVKLALRNTQLTIIFLAGLVTLIAGAITFWLLKRCTLQPIKNLTEKMNLLREDRSHLGDEIAIEGTSEIVELAGNFNAMTRELKGLYEALEDMAFTDSLTKLPNRNQFNKQLDSLLNEFAAGQDGRCALLIIDLNRFKAVNDTLGHHVGDQVLIEIGRRLRASLRAGDIISQTDKTIDASTFEPREHDTVARLGGDEFSIIIKNTSNRENITTVAKKLLKTMDEPFVFAGKNYHIGLSIGIALYPEHGSDKSTLLKNADLAMYHAKKTKCGYTFFESSMDTGDSQSLTLEQDLADAISNNGLSLNFQPKVDLKTGKTIGAEALARWIHPERGFIPPEEFIALAEHTGLILPLTTWVLKEALSSCHQWQKAGYHFGVSVNLSTLNLVEHYIDDEIQEIVDQSPVSPELITLEITESSVMADPDYALKMLKKLRAMGFTLSIDDFGTGYSSLTYLMRLPANEIKIDKSFVFDMAIKKECNAIVRSTITLAHNLGFLVVAEGVEEEISYKELRTLGCDIAQGYYIARPMPLCDYLNWLENETLVESMVTNDHFKGTSS